MENTIYHNLIIHSDLSSVFTAISNPEHLINWWPLKCSGVPKEGELYNFNFTDKYDWYGTAIKVIPNKSFHIKMTKADPDWDPTTFGFELESLDEKSTKVIFTHQNWPELNDHFKTASYCWVILLQGLKNYLEKGIILPFDERS